MTPTRERTREQFIVKKHFMFHHKGIVSSYAMKNIGFGIEFCNNMDLYEVNYGMQMQSGTKVEINNDGIIPESGFVTCRHCGKSTPLLSKLNREHQPVEQHSKFCNHKNVNFAEDLNRKCSTEISSTDTSRLKRLRFCCLFKSWMLDRQ